MANNYSANMANSLTPDELATLAQNKAMATSEEMAGMPTAPSANLDIAVNPWLSGIMGAASGMQAAQQSPAGLGGFAGALGAMLPAGVAGYKTSQQLIQEAKMNSTLDKFAPALADELMSLGIKDAGRMTLGQIKDFMPLIEAHQKLRSNPVLDEAGSARMASTIRLALKQQGITLDETDYNDLSASLVGQPVSSAVDWAKMFIRSKSSDEPKSALDRNLTEDEVRIGKEMGVPLTEKDTVRTMNEKFAIAKEKRARADKNEYDEKKQPIKWARNLIDIIKPYEQFGRINWTDVTTNTGITPEEYSRAIRISTGKETGQYAPQTQPTGQNVQSSGVTVFKRPATTPKK